VRSTKDMDDDVRTMSTDELIGEVVKLRQAIRIHRDSSGHDLCWHHPEMWSLLPESYGPVPEVPEWPVFLRGCLRYRQSLDDRLPDAPQP